MATGQPTTTSFSILCLLAVRPFSTYELTQQMLRSVGRMWPRAESKLYEEPKKLVALGYATATTEMVGQRQRTVYEITEQGRRALALWLEEPGGGPVLEFEQLIKVAFSDHGTRDGARRTVAAARAWAVERNRENLDAAAAYASGSGPFQDRAAQGMLAGKFFTEFYAMVAGWADWADEQIGQWPDNPADATANPTELAAILERARWSAQD
jgi:PadR family transcriptional regulator, regulatory protein AphA